MSKARKLVLSIALIAAVFTGYLLMKRNDSTVAVENDDISNQEATDEVVVKAEEYPALITSNENSPAPTSGFEDDETTCISMAELESDPVIAAEYARFDSLVTAGPAIESYRGLSSAQLGSLVLQGDSAAMAVLGAISVMRAMNLSEDVAVSRLLLDEASLQSFRFERPLDPETAKHLGEASEWFYKAALHGRLLALQNMGEIVAVVGGSPVELGWIEQDEYETLEPFEQHSLDPVNVYGALAFEIAPDLRTGPLGTMISEQMPGGERQQFVLGELAWQFDQDRDSAGLPPIDVQASNAPSMEDLESLLCEP